MTAPALEEIQAAYGDGWTAEREGGHMGDNPHPPQTLAAFAWEDGYAQAAADH